MILNCTVHPGLFTLLEFALSVFIDVIYDISS